MADISEVEQTVVDMITSILYPAGSSKSSVIGNFCRIYRGWPNAAALNSDLGGGTINVTVVTDNDSGRITTRYLPTWKTIPSEPGVVVSNMDNTLSVGGNPTPGDVVGALINRHAYAYRVQPNDTTDLVAAKLSGLIQNDFSATVTGSIVTILGATSLRVKVVCDQLSLYESRRQEKDVRLIFWCPNPLIRDAAVSAVDAALSGTAFLSTLDGTSIRLIYKNTSSYDQAQNALLYRRDLIYTVEYPTTSINFEPAMLFGASELDRNITYN